MQARAYLELERWSCRMLRGPYAAALVMCNTRAGIHLFRLKLPAASPLTPTAARCGILLHPGPRVLLSHAAAALLAPAIDSLNLRRRSAKSLPLHPTGSAAACARLDL